MTVPTAFHDLPERCFPFTIEFFPADDPDETTPLHVIEVPGPGSTYIPAMPGGRTRVKVTYGDGTVFRA